MKRGLPLLWLLLCASCAAPAIVPTPTVEPLTATPEPLQVVCAESLEPLCRILASAYQRENPLVQIVLAERADTLAWQALEQGDAAVAALTWLPPERPEGWWQAPFARDGLAIVVNRQNGLPGLTVGQLRELFQGRVEDWGPWGGLPGVPQVISREEASGDYALFQEQVMGDFPVTLTAFLAPGSEAVLEMVAENQLAVGYLSTAWLDEERVRPLAIEGVPPVPEALVSDLYPLTRDLYLVTPEEPQGVTRDFVQWILGPEGQSIARRQGWLLPESRRYPRPVPTVGQRSADRMVCDRPYGLRGLRATESPTVRSRHFSAVSNGDESPTTNRFCYSGLKKRYVSCPISANSGALSSQTNHSGW